MTFWIALIGLWFAVGTLVALAFGVLARVGMGGEEQFEPVGTDNIDDVARALFAQRADFWLDELREITALVRGREEVA
jgi:hypothetical protein